jgi:hypothetical protein
VTVLPGKSAVAGRVKDHEITVEAEILDLSK